MVAAAASLPVIVALVVFALIDSDRQCIAPPKTSLNNPIKTTKGRSNNVTPAKPLPNVVRIPVTPPTTAPLPASQYSVEGLVFALTFDDESLQPDGIESVAGPRRKAVSRDAQIANGKYGKGLQQTGKGGLFVEDLKASEAVSVCFWFRLDKDEGPFWFFNFHGSHAANHVYPSKDYVDIIYPDGLTAVHPRLETNRWYHIAFVWDWKQSRCKLYLDGVLFKEEPVPNNFVPRDSKGADIGICYDDSSVSFLMDEFLVFDRQLEQPEVHSLAVRLSSITSNAVEPSTPNAPSSSPTKPIPELDTVAGPLSDHLWPTPEEFLTLRLELRIEASRYQELPDIASEKALITTVAFWRAFRKLELGKLGLASYDTSSTHGKLYLQGCSSSAAGQVGATLNAWQILGESGRKDTELIRLVTAIKEGKTTYDEGKLIVLSEDRWYRLMEEAGIEVALARAIRNQTHFNKRMAVESAGGHSVRWLQLTGDIRPRLLRSIVDSLRSCKIGNLSEAEAFEIGQAYVNVVFGMEVDDFATKDLRSARCFEVTRSSASRLKEKEARSIAIVANHEFNQFALVHRWKSMERLYAMYATEIESEWRDQQVIVETWLDEWCRQNGIRGQ